MPTPSSFVCKRSMAGRLRGYRLSRRAEADLESIYDYTRENWSKKQADKYYGELIAGFEDLLSGRRIGRDAELGHGVLKLPVGSHMVFYQAVEGKIDIIRILHRAMDVSRHLRS